MKRLKSLAVFAFISATAWLGLSAQGPDGAARADSIRVGYTHRGGTFVRPRYRTSPNSFVYDNWSRRGNINSYTDPGRVVQRRYPDYSSSGIYSSPYAPNNSYLPSRSRTYGSRPSRAIRQPMTGGRIIPAGTQAGVIDVIPSSQVVTEQPANPTWWDMAAPPSSQP